MKINLKKLPERNNQAELYRALWNRGIPCYLEVAYDGCRFDAVVIKDEEIVCIIEVKKGDRQRDPSPKQQIQIDRYAKYGVPVFFCSSRKDIPYLANQIKVLYNAS